MRLKITFYLCFILSVILGLSLYCSAENGSTFSLRLEVSESRKVLLDLSVNPGDEFYIHYIHSSDKTPVRDTFRINEEGQLILIEEAFLWHGAGLEFQSHGDIHLAFDGKWSKVRLNRFFPELVIRVGRIAKQRLIFKDRSIYLDSLVRPGESIILSITQ